MELKIYQVDAFADVVFAGNPAAVCPLDSWLPDELLQKIAMENNLAETAYYVKEKEGYRIRWFTPTVEVDLCGHATLASAFILFHHEGYQENQIIFNSRSGPLTVTKEKDLITLNFPTDQLQHVDLFPELAEPFHIKPLRAFKGKSDYMLIFENESQVRSLAPDFRKLAKVQSRGVIVTARGDKVDFVSRFFGPQSGIDEDPVTGSAHTTLIPYWAGVLGKNVLTAFQCSARGGMIYGELKKDRVDITGQGKLYLVGKIFVD